MSSFIYGLPPAVEDAQFLNIDKLEAQVGGNTGNLAFCYALWRNLDGLPIKSWLEERSALFTPEATGVMTLANQLGPHADLGYFDKLIKRHQSKLVGVGLGAQAGTSHSVEIPAGTIAWLKTIQDRAPTSAPNLGVRGEFTLKVLQEKNLASNAVVVGCPSLFISPNKRLGAEIQSRWTGDPQKIAVTAGHPRWTHLAKIEKSLVALLTGIQDYIVQSPKSMIAFGHGKTSQISTEDLMLIRDYIDPELPMDCVPAWAQDHAVSFFSALAWMEHIRHFDFVVGSRIHGVMLAMQMGVPAMCITHDSRTLELCQTMMVPYVEAKDILRGFTKKMLLDQYQFDGPRFDRHRQWRANIYHDFLLGNLLKPADYLKNLAT